MKERRGEGEVRESRTEGRGMYSVDGRYAKHGTMTEAAIQLNKAASSKPHHYHL